MAKKTLKEGELPSVFDMVQSVDKTAEIIAESAYSNIKDFIPTGNYMLNCCMSGDIYGGVPCGRVTTFYGPSSVGKSFLACSCAREAQKKGYTVIYLDSEGSIDAKFVSRLGVDPTKLIIKQVSTIAETSQFIANICDQLQKQEDEYGRHQNVMIVLDSLGNLTSDKEREDTMSGANKRDMTKAQEVKAMFRVNATPLARLGIPMIVNNHSYAQIGAYVPTQVMSSGTGLTYNSSITIELSAAKLDDKANEAAAASKQGADTTTKNGILVTAKPVKSRFCRPYKVKFQIPYFHAPNQFIGLETFMNWDNAGVGRGTLITEKDYNKLTDAGKEKIKVFDFNGTTMYAELKETARNIICKHLGRAVPVTEFFSSTVFTPEYLDYINKNIIHPMFDLPDQSSFEDIEEIEDLITTGEQTDESED